MMERGILHLKKRNIIWCLIISWLILIFTLQATIGAGYVKTHLTTITDYSTITITETKEQTLIKTIVNTITGPKIEETEYKTYTTVTTKKVVYSITYRYTTVTSRSKVDQGWHTIYIISEVREDVPVTVTAPRRIKTTVPGFVTLTESVVTTYLTEYELVYTMRTNLKTMTLTRIFETEYLEEFEEEKPNQFTSFLKDYGLIIAAIIIIVAFAIIPKEAFRRRKLRRRLSIVHTDYSCRLLSGERSAIFHL